MQFFVYVLRSEANGRYYVGCSGDADRRLVEHNSGKVASTKAYRRWARVYSEEHADRLSARRRERHIKSMKSRRYLESLIDSQH